MRKILAVVLALFASTVSAELRVPVVRGGRAPLSALVAPTLAQVVSVGPSGGGGGLTFGGTSGGTATRVPFTDGSGNFADDADLIFVTDTLTATKLIVPTLGTFGTASGAANSIDVDGTTGCVVGEGLTANAAETTLCFADVAGDVILNTPTLNAGTYVVAASSGALTSGRMTFATTNGALADDADCTFATDTLTCTKMIGSTSITDTGLTATRVTFAGTGGLLSDDADLTFATDTLTATKIAGTTFTGNNIHTARDTFGSAADAANAVDFGRTTGSIDFEGTTADGVELSIVVADPTTADKTWTIPNLTAAAHTFQDLETAQTVSGAKTSTGGITISGANLDVASSSNLLFASTQHTFRFTTVYTPDGMGLGTGALSNSFHVVESADLTAFDFQNCSAGTSAATDPLLCIHSHNQSATQYLDFSHNATNGVINVGVGGLDVAAHLGAHGTAPAVTSCGSSPTTVTGNDSYGRLTTGTGGTVQSCTLTFATAYAVAPSCTANDESAILLVRAVATTTTLVIDSAVAGTLASQVLTYTCRGL